MRITLMTGYDIRNLRKHLGVKRKALAKASGVPYGIIGQYERGQVVMTNQRFKELLLVLISLSK